MEINVSKSTYFKKLKNIVESICSEFLLKLEEHQREVDQLAQIYSEWLSKTDKVILSLQGILHEIEKHQLNVNIASITGSSVSFLSGAACLGGLVLAPVTGGLSLVLTTGGLVGGTAGILTSQGARMVECGLKFHALEGASKQITDHCEETLKFTAKIDTCRLEEENILNFLHTSSLVQEIKVNKAVYMELFNNEEMQEVLHRIEEESASLNDYILFINFVSSEDLKSLKKCRKIKVIHFTFAVMTDVARMCSTLRSSIKNIGEFVAILKSWRSGVSAVRVASKASRVSKGLFLGLSMAFDVYDIATSAHEIATKVKPEEIKDLKNVIDELIKQKNEVVSLFH